jgi:hypothetical protein
MRKGHHGGPRETTSIAHQDMTDDKATRNKRQTPKQISVMKVDAHNTLFLIA